MSYVIRETENGIGLQGENLAFFRYKGAESVLAGPADTGKTFALCLKVHLCACKYPGASIAIVRRTQTSCYNTVIRTFTERILGPDPTKWPCIPYGGMNRPERFNYDNGSVIFIAGLDKPSRLLSSEFDVVAVSQTEEISLSAWEMLLTRATGRHGAMPYAMVCGDANPASNTHWILSRRNGGRLKLFESTHKDNPQLWDAEKQEWTRDGIKRRDRLRSLSGARYQRLFLGLWAPPEGAIYDCFEHDRHVVKSFDVPGFWPRAVGIDPFGAYVSAVWVAFDPGNKVLNVYREYIREFGETTPQHVRNVLSVSHGEPIFVWVGGGPSERQQRTDWSAAGIPLQEPPFADVWAGIDRVYNLLKTFNLVIHDCCTNLISEIGEYSRRVGRDGVPTESIEDKEKFHGLDALRYVVAYLTQPAYRTEIIDRLVPIGPAF